MLLVGYPPTGMCEDTTTHKKKKKRKKPEAKKSITIFTQMAYVPRSTQKKDVGPLAGLKSPFAHVIAGKEKEA